MRLSQRADVLAAAVDNAGQGVPTHRYQAQRRPEWFGGNERYGRSFYAGVLAKF